MRFYDCPACHRNCFSREQVWGMFRASFNLVKKRAISRCSWCRERVRTGEPALYRSLNRILVLALALPIPVFISQLLIFRIPDPLSREGMSALTLGERLTMMDPSLPLAITVPVSLLVLLPLEVIASRILFSRTRLVRVNP